MKNRRQGETATIYSCLGGRDARNCRVARARVGSVEYHEHL